MHVQVGDASRDVGRAGDDREKSALRRNGLSRRVKLVLGNEPSDPVGVGYVVGQGHAQRIALADANDRCLGDAVADVAEPVLVLLDLERQALGAVI